MSVDVPLEDDYGKVIGWDTVSSQHDVHEAIIKRNHKHFSQAKNTPFCKGKHHKDITGDNKEDNINAILEGKYDTTNSSPAIREYVHGLCRAYDEKFKNEADRINDPVSFQDFIHYFKHKKESTESLPSGRHVGHYKAVVQHPGIIQVHIDMANIGIKCGCALDRWKRVIGIMLEKKPGNCRLHRLRIIQLMEADYNFVLALLFGHRLANFAHKRCNMNMAQFGSTVGRQCQSAVLMKVLVYDLMQL